MTIIDGEINVRVVGAPWPGNSGLLSAISIQATDSFQPILIKAGGGTYTDSRGRVWVSDAPFVTGGSYFAPSGAMPTISETLDQGLYTSERFGDFKYDIPKLNAASYAITFHFAELYFWASDQRVFDIYVEGNLATKNVDIIQLGYGTKNRAITIEWLQVVSDGVLTIEFKSVGKNSPKLSAIEINYRLPHLAHAVSNGPYQVVDTRNVKKRKVHVDGTSSHTHKQGISLKDFMWKEGSKLLGRGAEADFDLSVGNHTVTLYVRDSDGNDAADSTTVSVLPFGNANVDSLVPNKGGLQGGSQVTIKGSGFGYPASSIVVNFGDYKLTNTQVQVIDKKTLVVAAPPNPNGVPVPVSVTTPLGSSNKIPYTYVDGLSISFESGKIADLYGPACGTFGPDGRLYVGTSNGRVVRYTLDSEYKKVVAYVESSVIWQKHGFKDRAILGIAFDPLDTQENPTVYVSHNFFFHGESKSSSFDAINGKVSTLSGANLDVYTDIITGLPVSDHDHGVNGLEFGDFGELYIQIGGNTNGTCFMERFLAYFFLVCIELNNVLFINLSLLSMYHSGRTWGTKRIQVTKGKCFILCNACG